ncbi:hypothetical protein VCRA2126O85_280048 [Vibrio crassostreae]|nr:hypothetical protein VCRA2114E327_40052 [Vibrio crassostreae]CAK2798545.1 hypothetical protein VCRA2125O83_260038 [Vibrio crassostreae]CAK2798672.1 hypothetical protein VCRA2128O106_260048 [Vibrio crassostreae]CAK2801144.1 hypothetical protein VCRA2128O100_280049 [Vibrio crassostreae]CAK2805198.1 hypothetical protein VCRA2127O91_280038 [Vibrio crassostreae]
MSSFNDYQLIVVDLKRDRLAIELKRVGLSNAYIKPIRYTIGLP